MSHFFFALSIEVNIQFIKDICYESVAVMLKSDFERRIVPFPTRLDILCEFKLTLQISLYTHDELIYNIYMYF